MPDADPIPPERVRGALKTLSLAQLNEWLWARESNWGPVIAIGHGAGGTAATFRYADERPSRAVIVVIVDGQDPAVPGKAEVCRGTVFVEGKLTPVAVFR